MQALNSGAGGLATADARQRLQRHGPNQPAPHRRRLLAAEFLSRFRNPLVVLLLAASVMSFITGDAASSYVIGVIIVLSVSLDFAQEYRAERAIDKLRESVSCTATLLRDGVAVERPLRDVVPGDVALLRAGDIVPADGVLLEARDLFVNQALLTGEPFPVEKHASVAQSVPVVATPLAEDDAVPHAVFMNTSVVSGTARMLVCQTGSDTRLAGIAQQLTGHAGPNPLEEGSRRFGLLILRMTLLLVLFVLLVNAALHRAWLESFMFSVALAVGLTPELLPMIVTVSLARGALRMAHKGVIIKRQAAIHNLGGIDTLCTDKTGTLTEANIVLERHVNEAGAENSRVLELAQANSYFESGIKSPLDDAILRHAAFNAGRWRKIDEVPFDFERRRVAVLLDDGARRLLIVKGAPEAIISHCTEFEAGGEGRIMAADDTVRRRLLARFQALEEDGLRVIAVAWRETPRTQEHALIDDEAGLVFCGFAAFFDPPRAEAGEAVAALAQAGIAVKIVTGDHEGVARHVCRETGIAITGVLSGAQIAALDDHALLAQLESVNLICRVSPAQKSRVIALLRRGGHAVGFMGDGINDAPALHAADVGISVDTGVDVAKEAADVILLKHDLRVLLDGVREGRRAQNNVFKYVMMATSSNFGNMASVAVGSAVLPFLPMLPIQILLNNLLYDVSEFAIPFDNSDEEELTRPRPWDISLIRNFMLTVGPVSSLFDLLTFYVMLHLFAANEALFRTGWFVESLATQVLVIFVIRTRRPLFDSRPAAGLVAMSLGVVLLGMWLPFSPLAGVFGFVALPAAYFGLLAVMVALYLLLVEWSKRVFFRRLNGHMARR